MSAALAVVVDTRPWLMVHIALATLSALFIAAIARRIVLPAVLGVVISILLALLWRHADFNAGFAWAQYVRGPFSHGWTHACEKWPVVDDFENFALGWLCPLAGATIGALSGLLARRLHEIVREWRRL